MKKSFVIFAVLLMILIQYTGSVEITFSKDSYYPRETLQVELTGNFVTLSSKNLFIYREGTPRPMPVISELTRQKEVYFFYAILPHQEGNYTLRIEDSQYYSSGNLVSDLIEVQFQIKNTNSSYLSINPGFVISNKEISLKIKSINGNSGVSVFFEGYNENFSLIDEAEKMLFLPIENVTSSNPSVKINNYEVPVFLVSSNYTEEPVPESRILFNPDRLEGRVRSGEIYSFKFLLKNSGEQNLTGIGLSTDLDITLTPSRIDYLPSGRNYLVNFSISVPEKQKKNISGEITAEFNNNSLTLPVFFEIAEESQKIDINTSITSRFTCEEMEGETCLYGETCIGEITASTDGPCCLGECSEKKETNYSWIFGIVLLLIVIGIILYSYFLAKRKQKPQSSEELLKEKSEKFRKRMSPENSEVRGRLDRI
jgi:hypothetical protein